MRAKSTVRVCLAEYFAYAYIMGYVLELGNVYERNVVYVVNNVKQKQRVLFPLDGRTCNVSPKRIIRT